ncbi:MAG TPA: MBL fold metallo-hydrolase [Gammaproteobacteria bacterium]|nr:MBL fold metallo-hydrolase [Gammaproteobacteria bacterium]
MRRYSRRRVLGAGIGTAAFASLPFPVRRSSALAQGSVATQALGGSLHMLTAAGVNVVARTGGDGVLLVDGGSTATSAGILEAAAGLPDGGPVRTLFNTHWHPDQTGSNLTLGEAGATIIAQENTRLWLTTDIVYPWDETQRFDPLPQVAQPTLSFYDTGELESGVQYGYLRHAAHTDGDLYVYFPDDDVLAIGDAVSGDGWPFIDWWTGGWIGGVVGTYELILSLMNDGTRLVPGRGPVLQRPAIEAQFEMYNMIYDRLATMLNDGFGPDEAIAANPTAEFDAEMGPPELFVRRAFESLWAYLSPDA